MFQYSIKHDRWTILAALRHGCFSSTPRFTSINITIWNIYRLCIDKIIINSYKYSLHVSTVLSFREHAYSNILKIWSPKNESFQMKNSSSFHISAQNIDCGYSLEPPVCGYSLEPPRRGGSNEYPHPMFLSSNKKNNVYPCKSQFYYIKSWV